MKKAVTINNLNCRSCVILICILLLISGIETLSGQVLNVDNGIRFGEGKLNPQEEALLQDYLENYDEMRELGNGYPPIWDDPAPQDKPHGIIVALEANPRINDIELDKYDYIGGFYTDDNGELRCGGAGYWPDSLGIVFALQRDDTATPQKDGFVFQEQIYFKLFSFSTMKDYLVDVVEFDPEFYGTDKWGALGLSRLLDMQALEDLDFYIQPSGNPICIGNQLTLSGQEFIGSGGNYSFEWTSDPPGFNHNTQFPPPTTPETTTIYNLLVEDGTSTSEHSLTVFVEEFPIAFAGDNDQVCANESVELAGQVQNSNVVEWTTSGDGVFDDSTSLNAIYTPGELDVTMGQVTLTLTALPLNPCDLTATDDLVLEVLPLPDIVVGEDIIGCTTEDIEVTAVASDYSTLEWVTSGSGTFTDPNSLSTFYIAGGNDFENGVFLTACVEAVSPCLATACDTIHVEYVPGPTALGMTSNTGCENNFLTVSGIAYNYSSTEWTTAGDGTFEDPSLFSTKYYPGTQDAENGGTVVTLNAYPIGNCDTATKDVILNVVNLPEISFGPNSGNICLGDQFLQLDASVEYSNSILWSTNGDGTFNTKSIPNPKYYPGPEDVQNGQFELELLAYPLPYCSVSTIENLTVIYQDNPVAFAGPDAEICENETYQLSEAQAESFGNLSWSGGNGEFSNTSTLNPEYIPSPEDVGNTITLCLDASPISPCDVAASDCMELTIYALPEADAGEDAEICETEVHQLNGMVDGEMDFAWTTSGDGNFSDSSIENPVYTPGPADIASGSVTLTLTAQPNAPCTAVAEDSMQLDIQLATTASAGDDAIICDTENHTLASAEAANFATLSWETGGDGTFDDPTAVNPTYFPGANDIELGTTELTLQATAVAPCVVDIIDSKTLTIIRSVEADAGADGEICETATWLLNGTVDYTEDFAWTTSGDGNFSDPAIENPVYTPGPADIAGGSVTLTLTAQPNAPCTAVAEDSMQLDIQLATTASAGDDAIICDTENHTLASAEAANFATLSWETGGDGTFDDPTAVNPTYFPGANDIELGTTELTLQATAVAPCVVDITDSKTLTIIRSVEADAGADGEICETGTWLLNGTVDYTEDFAWTTSGDGNFSDPAIENPVYTPGPADIAGGLVTLTLTAQPNAPCTISATDFITIDITQLPALDIGNQLEVCGSESIVLDDVTADHYSDLLWTTSGDGTFSDPQALVAEYFPGSNDLNNNDVTLTLTLNSMFPCSGEVSADKLLSVALPPVAQAGEDIITCSDQIDLNASAENFTSVIWTTFGDGTFNNPSMVDATYFPGTNDLAAGQVELTLSASANAPCTIPATDALMVEFGELELDFDNVVDKEVQRGNLLFLSFGVTSQISGEYAWYFNGDLLPSQIGPTLMITNMQPENAGHYQGTFTNECGTVETNTGFVQVVESFAQDISIPQGWSGFSSFVNPDIPAMEDVFAPVENELIILSNNEGVYWPGQNTNTLGNFSVTQGYEVKMAATASLEVNGKIRYPLSEIILEPGWSYLPVNTNCAVNVADKFGATPALFLIKEIAGTGIYWPDLGINTLNEILPGNAYLVLNNSAENVMVKFDPCDNTFPGTGLKSGVPDVGSPWNRVSLTGKTHVLGFAAGACASFESGDIIGAFAGNGLCAGLVEVDGYESAPLVVFGDDVLTGTVDGMAEGEMLTLKLYRPSTGEIFDLEANFNENGADAVGFMENGTSVINKLDYKSATGIENITGENFDMDIYPNPTDGVLSISIHGNNIESGKILLTNAGGQVVMSDDFTASNDLTINIGGFPQGVYYLKVVAGESVKISKVILR